MVLNGSLSTPACNLNKDNNIIFVCMCLANFLTSQQNSDKNSPLNITFLFWSTGSFVDFDSNPIFQREQLNLVRA